MFHFSELLVEKWEFVFMLFDGTEQSTQISNSELNLTLGQMWPECHDMIHAAHRHNQLHQHNHLNHKNTETFT